MVLASFHPSGVYERLGNLQFWAWSFFACRTHRFGTDRGLGNALAPDLAWKLQALELRVVKAFWSATLEVRVFMLRTRTVHMGPI